MYSSRQSSIFLYLLEKLGDGLSRERIRRPPPLRSITSTLELMTVVEGKSTVAAVVAVKVFARVYRNAAPIGRCER